MIARRNRLSVARDHCSKGNHSEIDLDSEGDFIAILQGSIGCPSVLDVP